MNIQPFSVDLYEYMRQARKESEGRKTKQFANTKEITDVNQMEIRLSIYFRKLFEVSAKERKQEKFQTLRLDFSRLDTIPLASLNVAFQICWTAFKAEVVEQKLRSSTFELKYVGLARHLLFKIDSIDLSGTLDYSYDNDEHTLRPIR